MVVIGEILLMVIYCTGILWSFSVQNRKFLLFPSNFGSVAIKAMAFWEMLAFSQLNLPFAKIIKWFLCK